MDDSLAARLAREGASGDLVAWARPFGNDGARALELCEDGAWTLTIARTLGYPLPALVRASVACADFALELIDDPSVLQPALDAARAWSDRQVPIDPELRIRCEALVRNETRSGARQAAAAVLYCLLATEQSEAACSAALAATDAHALHSHDCAADAARRYAARLTADRVREALGSLQASSL